MFSFLFFWITVDCWQLNKAIFFFILFLSSILKRSENKNNSNWVASLLVVIVIIILAVSSVYSLSFYFYFHLFIFFFWKKEWNDGKKATNNALKICIFSTLSCKRLNKSVLQVYSKQICLNSYTYFVLRLRDLSI